MGASDARTPALLTELAQRTATGAVVPNARTCALHVVSPTVGEISTAAGGIDADASFRVASVTKMVTAAALMRLVDRGHCELDDPVGSYIDARTLDGVLPVEGRPAGAELTLAQLLDHTSGLPDFWAHPMVHAAARGGADRPFDPLDLLQLVRGAEALFAPGTGRSYNDTGFLLAGLVIENIVGLPLHDVYRAEIFEPLGMGDTWLEGAEQPRGRPRPAPHLWADGSPVELEPTIDWAGGGLVSTTADLMSFLRALVRGEVVTESSFSRMTAWRPGPSGYYDDYGLGVGRLVGDGYEAIGHHGVWGAFAFWYPDLDAFVAGTVNTARADRRPLVKEVRSIVDPAGP